MTELRGRVALITAVFAMVGAGLVVAASLPSPIGNAGAPATTASGGARAPRPAVAAQEQALTIRVQRFGKNDTLVAQTLIDLASLATSLGQHERSDSLGDQALRILRKAYGDRDLRVATAMSRIVTSSLRDFANSGGSTRNSRKGGSLFCFFRVIHSPTLRRGAAKSR